MSETKQGQDWQRYPVKSFGGGLNTQFPPEEIKDEELSDCSNVTFLKGALRTDTGYSLFTSTGLIGIPTSSFQFFNTNGSSILYCSTTIGLFWLNDAVNEWDFVTDADFASYSTTTTATAGAGATSVTTAISTGWGTNWWIGIRLSDGTELKTQVTSTSGTTVHFSPAIPTGKSATSGTAIYIAFAAGALTDPQSSTPQWLTLPWNNTTLFTTLGLPASGVPQITGTSAKWLLPTGLSTFNCASLALFHDMVFLINTVENGTDKPQRVRRSDAGNETNWTTGLAGFDDLLDTEDFILSGNILGPWLILYRETSIMRGTFYGGPAGINPVIYWEYMIQGEGAISTGAIAETGSEHFFVGNAGLYLYTGGYDLESIGDNIFWTFLAIGADLNPNARSKLFAFYVQEIDEVWVLYPSGSSNVCNKLIRVVLENNSIYIREFANSICGFGFYQTTLSRTWQQATYPWSSANFPWVSQIFTSNAPVTLLCDAVLSLLYSYDYVTQNDNGVAIPWSFNTKDFSYEVTKSRINRLILKAGGGTFNVLISLDHGQTWQNYATVTAGSTPSRFLLSGQFVSDVFRFQFTGAASGFSIEWMIIEWMEESEW